MSSNATLADSSIVSSCVVSPSASFSAREPLSRRQSILYKVKKTFSRHSSRLLKADGPTSPVAHHTRRQSLLNGWHRSEPIAETNASEVAVEYDDDNVIGPLRSDCSPVDSAPSTPVYACFMDVSAATPQFVVPRMEALSSKKRLGALNVESRNSRYPKRMKTLSPSIN